MNKDLVYGHISGGKASVPVTSSEEITVTDQGGKFVFMDSGYVKLSGDGDTSIFGWIEAAAGTYASGTKFNCIIDPTAMFRIGVNAGTLTAAMNGESCDLSVASNVQGLQVNASTEDVVQIIEVDATNQIATVRMNPSKVIPAGVV